MQKDGVGQENVLRCARLPHCHCPARPAPPALNPNPPDKILYTQVNAVTSVYVHVIPSAHLPN